MVFLVFLVFVVFLEDSRFESFSGFRRSAEFFFVAGCCEWLKDDCCYAHHHHYHRPTHPDPLGFGSKSGSVFWFGGSSTSGVVLFPCA